jgi:hypothetical protein
MVRFIHAEHSFVQYRLASSCVTVCRLWHIFGHVVMGLSSIVVLRWVVRVHYVIVKCTIY